jgi:hypothetical protein
MLGSPNPQVNKFRELALELECDDDEARFDEQVRNLAKAPRQLQPKRPSA